MLIATIGFVLAPLLASGFNGFVPDQFPIPQIDPAVQPAGYAFSIWGLIYVWLMISAVFGVVSRDDAPEWTAPRGPLLISLVAGVPWLAVAQASPFWASLLIWVMQIFAVRALLRTGQSDRLWLRTPVALYAGWLTAAGTVALGLMLAGHGILSETAAALLCLSLGLAIAVIVQSLRPDTPEYSGAVIWALVAVGVANYDPMNASILALVTVGIVALLAMAWRGMRHG